MMKKLIICTLTTFMLIHTSYAKPEDWFEKGERLHYLVEMWGWLNVGEAELLFKPQDDRYTILARAWTDSRAFQLRDRLTTEGIHSPVLDEGPFYSIRQTIELNENDYRGHKTITFDRNAKMIRYHNIRGNEKPVGFGAPEHTRDMISALYYFRKTLGDREIKVGDMYQHAVAQNDYIYDMKLKVVGQGKIDGHQALKVQPSMQKLNRDGTPLGDVKDRWTIWVRNDKSFVPQRIEAKTKFGSFVASLKRYGHLDLESRVIPEIPETGEIIMDKKKTGLLETAD
ncbi:MAG: DUF3108 domain-containing protein [Pseudomonadota bacterium]|nr:DUF3108 domain-containing protein [Pseudomonadota bacterium]